MSRWFRHYAGMVRDDKLVRAALKSKQTVERVVWVWGAILESAAEIDDNGRYEIDHAEIAYFLRADEDDIGRIEVALCDLGRVHSGVVAKWASRQFQSDKSAERTKRYRDRQKSHGDGTDGSSRDGDVTSPTRHGDSPETETETDSSVANATAAQGAAPVLASPVDRIWAAAPELAVLANRPETAIRSFLGKALKEFDPELVEPAISAALSARTGDPCGYITRTLKPAQPKARASPFANPNDHFDERAFREEMRKRDERAQAALQ